MWSPGPGSHKSSHDQRPRLAPTASGSSLTGLAGSTRRGEEILKKWEPALKQACFPKTASLPCLTWEGREAERSIPRSAHTSPPPPAPSRAPRSPALPGVPLSLQCCWKWPLPFALINLSLSPKHIWGRGKRWEHSGKGPRINLHRLHVTKPLPSESNAKLNPARLPATRNITKKRSRWEQGRPRAPSQAEPCPAALTALVWERRSGCSMDVWKEMGKSTALIGGAVMELGKRVTCSAATGVNRKTKRKEKACGKTNINTQPCHSQLSSYLMSTFSPCAVH